jgi:hypothetical protein
MTAPGWAEEAVNRVLNLYGEMDWPVAHRKGPQLEAAATELSRLCVSGEEFELARKAMWRSGYLAGAYRPDWKGPPRGDDVEEAWKEWLEREEARAALKDQSKEAGDAP